MITHTQIKNDLVTWLGTLSLPVISGAIAIEAKQAPDSSLEKGKGTSIQAYLVTSEITSEERRTVTMRRTVRVLIRHRLVAESAVAKKAESEAWELLHHTLELRLLRYASADGECKATSVTTSVLLDGQQYYEEGVLAALVDVEIMNYEQLLT